MEWTVILPIAASTIGCLLSALSLVLWAIMNRISDGQIALAETVRKMATDQADRFSTVDNFLRTELRSIDVRLSVAETVLAAMKSK